jgi:FkbM family methyltransferase
VYIVDIIEFFDYYFDSAESIRVKINGSWRDLVDFSTPRFQKIVGFPDFPLMCPSLTEPFITTQQYLDFAQLSPGQVAIDLGSYSCLTSIAFSKAVGPSGHVIAIEPDPANFGSCQTNLAQHARSNGLSNITLVNAAVSDREGTLRFSAEGTMGSSAVDVIGKFRGNVIDVQCLSLQAIAEAHGLTRVDFVKMDIEGFEERVIAGAEAFFAKFRPRIIVEPHLVNGVLSDKNVMAVLARFGYECATLQQFGVDTPLITAQPRI